VKVFRRSRQSAARGTRHNAGSLSRSTYRQLDRQLACRYLAKQRHHNWPFDLLGAEYFPSPAPLQALACRWAARCWPACGLLDAIVRGAPETAARSGGAQEAGNAFRRLSHANLPLYFTGPEAERGALRQIFAHCKNLFPYLDASAIPWSVGAPHCFIKSASNARRRSFPTITRCLRASIPA